MDSSIFLYLLGSIFLLALIISSCCRNLPQPDSLPATVVITHVISRPNPEERGKRVIFSQAKAMKLSDEEAMGSNVCSICLVEFKDTDVLRLLHDCQHFFHLACVDPWLRLNPSCPVCRSSPIPPLSLTSLEQDDRLH